METIGSAVILAGGKSLRMGFDKQFLLSSGKRIIENQIEILREEFTEIIVVTNLVDRSLYKKCKMVCDKLPGHGPLSGIHAGLKAAVSKFVYFIACDMPVINIEYIRYMKNIVLQASPEVCITSWGKWVEPFNAFYSKAMIPTIENSMINRQKSLHKLYEQLRCHYITEAEARKFSPDFDMFMNLNTQEDRVNYEKMFQTKLEFRTDSTCEP